jgi:3-dehydrosphinganine reductase
MDLAFCTLLLTQPFVWLLVAAAAVLQSPVTLLASLLSRRKPRSFSGRHVLITGGSEGIGLEIAKQCAARGATVTLVARTRSKLDAARASVLAATPSAKVGVQTADVSQAAQVAQAVELGEKELGPVDVCIASAGASIPKYFEDLTHEDFAKMMSVNYFGGMPQRAPNPRLADPRQVCYSRVHALPWTVVNIAKAVLPGMVSRGEGQFAAVSSMAACVPFVGYAAYAPAKVGAA